MMRRTSIPEHFIRHGIAHLGFIRPVREKIDILDLNFTLFPREAIPFVKINVVTLLRETRCRLTMQICLDVVIEFP